MGCPLPQGGDQAVVVRFADVRPHMQVKELPILEGRQSKAGSPTIYHREQRTHETTSKGRPRCACQELRGRRRGRLACAARVPNQARQLVLEPPLGFACRSWITTR